MRRPLYLRTDTFDDAISSFEVACVFYERTQEDDRFWKWFVVACHSGVQGTFALALQRTDGLLVQKPGVAKAMLAAFEVRGMPPASHMDNFLRLHKKLHELGLLNTSQGFSLPSFKEQEEGLLALDSLRDEFLHFNTKSWSVEKELIRCRVRIGLRLSRQLLLETEAIRFYEDSDLERARNAIEPLCVQVDA